MKNSKIKVITIRQETAEFVNYCYLVFDRETREGLIIDPAWNINSIESQIRKNEIVPKYILLTHHHDDHINLSDALTKKYNIAAWINRKEFEYYDVQLNNLRLFDKKEIVMLGVHKCYALHTPGHTKGSTCFLIQDNLFTGDTLFNEGCGTCDEIGGSTEEMFASLQKIKSTIKQKCKMYSGHCFNGFRQGLTLETIMRMNIYLNIDEKKSFIKFRNRKNHPNYKYY